MVWNLIEEDKEYFASYGERGDEPIILTAIEHAGGENETGKFDWTR
ncbi:hypothetical protein [Planococcus lenghuensis]|nr:hypothetical protein [Planococcus lenghuensis]